MLRKQAAVEMTLSVGRILGGRRHVCLVDNIDRSRCKREGAQGVVWLSLCEISIQLKYQQCHRAQAYRSGQAELTLVI